MPVSERFSHKAKAVLKKEWQTNSLILFLLPNEEPLTGDTDKCYGACHFVFLKKAP